MTTTNLFGLDISTLSEQAVQAWLTKQLSLGQKTIIATPNPEIILKAQADPDYKKCLKSFDLLIPDGSGLLWAADLFNRDLKSSNKFLCILKIYSSALAGFMRLILKRTSIIKERVTGSDLSNWLIEQSQHQGLRLGLVGAGNGISAAAAKKIKENFPGINVFALQGGQIDIDGSTHSSEILDFVNSNQIQVLLVGFGAPKQEYWIQKNIQQMPSVLLAIGIGGTIDFIAGQQKRSPLFMKKIGLEWLWRLFRQPQRIGRIFNAVFKFSGLTIKTAKNNC